jgi:hypothetical protein
MWILYSEIRSYDPYDETDVERLEEICASPIAKPRSSFVVAKSTGPVIFTDYSGIQLLEFIPVPTPPLSEASHDYIIGELYRIDGINFLTKSCERATWINKRVGIGPKLQRLVA